jgi:zinc transporter 1/2/3
MAGLFISFLIDYVGHRIADSRKPSVAGDASSTSSTTAPNPEDKSGVQATGQDRNAFLLLDHHHGGHNNKLSVSLMEAGIIFHSIIIGLILVVTPNDSFNTLLVVVIFHQFFEGLALGARISLLPNTALWPVKFLMAFLFTLITPIGMAIGIGVLDSFNGNDPSTMIAFGTLNAISAGILIWVGVVDMWARDWVIEKGELLHSGVVKTVVAMVALVAGIVLMSVLGKWA